MKVKKKLANGEIKIYTYDKNYMKKHRYAKSYDNWLLWGRIIDEKTLFTKEDLKYIRTMSLNTENS